MSQVEVEDILQIYPDGLTSKQIKEKCNLSLSAIYTNLRKLKKRKLITIERIAVHDQHGHYRQIYRRIKQNG
jgi:predicted transcriptional regulator